LTPEFNLFVPNRNLARSRRCRVDCRKVNKQMPGFLAHASIAFPRRTNRSSRNASVTTAPRKRTLYVFLATGTSRFPSFLFRQCPYYATTKKCFSQLHFLFSLYFYYLHFACAACMDRTILIYRIDLAIFFVVCIFTERSCNRSDIFINQGQDRRKRNTI